MLFRKTLHCLGCSPLIFSLALHICQLVIMDHIGQEETTPTLPLYSLPPWHTNTHTHPLSLSLLCLSFYLSVSNNGAQQSKEDPVRCASAAGTAWPTGCRTCECIRACVGQRVWLMHVRAEWGFYVLRVLSGIFGVWVQSMCASRHYENGRLCIWLTACVFNGYAVFELQCMWHF